MTAKKLRALPDFHSSASLYSLDAPYPTSSYRPDMAPIDYVVACAPAAIGLGGVDSVILLPATETGEIRNCNDLPGSWVESAEVAFRSQGYVTE